MVTPAPTIPSSRVSLLAGSTGSATFTYSVGDLSASGLLDDVGSPCRASRIESLGRLRASTVERHARDTDTRPAHLPTGETPSEGVPGGALRLVQKNRLNGRRWARFEEFRTGDRDMDRQELPRRRLQARVGRLTAVAFEGGTYARASPYTSRGSNSVQTQFGLNRILGRCDGHSGDIARTRCCCPHLPTPASDRSRSCRGRRTRSRSNLGRQCKKRPQRRHHRSRAREAFPGHWMQNQEVPCLDGGIC